MEDLQNWINAENDNVMQTKLSYCNSSLEVINKDLRPNPGRPPAYLVSKDLRLCVDNKNLTKFIMDDGEDLSTCLIIIDFEHANFLLTSLSIHLGSPAMPISVRALGWELPCKWTRTQMLHLTVLEGTESITTRNSGTSSMWHIPST